VYFALNLRQLPLLPSFLQNDNGKRLPISNNDDNSSPISPSVIILNGSTTTANSRSSSSKSSPPGYVDFKENLSPGQLSSAFESVDDDNSPSSVDIPSSAFVDQVCDVCVVG
jgi:hypothetical protein